jgi:hypothetical protein
MSISNGSQNLEALTVLVLELLLVLPPGEGSMFDSALSGLDSKSR